LHADPEFSALFAQLIDLRLSATERVAYALSLETES